MSMVDSGPGDRRSESDLASLYYVVVNTVFYQGKNRLALTRTDKAVNVK